MSVTQAALVVVLLGGQHVRVLYIIYYYNIYIYISVCVFVYAHGAYLCLYSWTVRTPDLYQRTL
jgi:hypothetical protein